MQLGALEWEALRLSLAIALRSVAPQPPARDAHRVAAHARALPRPDAARCARAPAAGAAAGRGRLPAAASLFGARGPIGGWLERDFGVQLVFTRAGAALATAVMSFPLMVRAIRISLESVDRGLEQAARTLGARPLDRFFTITLPLITPGHPGRRDHGVRGRARRVRRRHHVRVQHPRARRAPCRSRSTPRSSSPAATPRPRVWPRSPSRWASQGCSRRSCWRAAFAPLLGR